MYYYKLDENEEKEAPLMQKSLRDTLLSLFDPANLYTRTYKSHQLLQSLGGTEGLIRKLRTSPKAGLSEARAQISEDQFGTNVKTTNVFVLFMCNLRRTLAAPLLRHLSTAILALLLTLQVVHFFQGVSTTTGRAALTNAFYVCSAQPRRASFPCSTCSCFRCSFSQMPSCSSVHCLKRTAKRRARTVE